MLVMQYQSEHTIAFDFNGNELMVNATEMAKPFGKGAKDFLKNSTTQEYIEVFCKRRNILLTDAVKVIHGGNNNGTWFHQKIALRFAQWLSPDFAIWVDEKIEELLTKGKTELVTTSPLSLARHMLEAMELQEQRLTTMETKVQVIEAKVSTVNDEYFSISGYYKLAGRRWDLDLKQSQRLGKTLAQRSKLNGYEVHQAYDAKYGHVNTYHKEVLRVELGF